MIQEYIDRFIRHKQKIIDTAWVILTEISIKEFVQLVVMNITDKYDVNQVHIIDDGDYQGTLLFVIPIKGYQPGQYLITKLGYGSCEVCDAWESARSSKDPAGIGMIALHLVQNMREV